MSSIRHIFWKPIYAIGLVVLAVLVIYIVGIFVFKDNLTIYNTVLAIILATLGWTLTIWMQNKTSVRQQTINILFNTYFINETFSRKREIVDRAYPKTADLTKLALEGYIASSKIEENELAAAIKYILNYCEYISASINLGDLDFVIFKETLEPIMMLYYNKFLILIKDIASEKETKYLEHMIILCAKLAPTPMPTQA